jgi:hypothetical protein
MSYMDDLIRDRLSLLFGNYEVNEDSSRLYDEILSSLISACEQHRGKGLTDFEIVDLAFNSLGDFEDIIGEYALRRDLPVSFRNRDEGTPNLQNRQIMFAKWEENGYYYPALITPLYDNNIKADFLNGNTSVISITQMVSKEEAYETFQLQGKWKNGGIFYSGKLLSHEPLTMAYDDGDYEHITLHQLRGIRPGEAPMGMMALLRNKVASLIK